MTIDELCEEVGIELELIEDTLRELSTLKEDIGTRDPSVREKTAAAAFMAQYYGGVENILKRMSRFHSIPIPIGETWHVDLFKRFCSPSYGPLPVLFDDSLAAAMSAFRKFRHVVYHGYGFQLDWSRMRDGMTNIEDVYRRFKIALNNYLHCKNK